MRRHPPLPLPGPSDFLWAAGIEDTFIAAPHPITGRILDEYALTEHYDRWSEDIELLAELGVKAARYGIPWHRVCPKPGIYDWSWTDRVLERLVNVHRIEPIIDLVHYGTPPWMVESFFDPAYPDHVSNYARAFAEHYRGLCYWYTPLNEPRVNAWYAGRIGWWPPCGRSWPSFARLLVQLGRGICRTQQAIQSEAADARFVHVDASDLYLPADSTDTGVAKEAAIRQDLVYLALDLVTGRVGANHRLRDWLKRMGTADSDVEWFESNAVTPDVVGFNMYPMFSRKIVRRDSVGRIRVGIRACWTETLEAIAAQYADRFPGKPLMITETACSGSLNRRIRWIEDSAMSVKRIRAAGIPLIGYTFWPLFSLVTWAYRQGRRPLEDYLLHMGLWDLHPTPDGLKRERTAAVEAFKRVSAA